MKNVTIATIFILLLTLGIFAQKTDLRINPNFEGTWILEDVDFHYPFSDKKYKETFKDETLTISLNNNEIKILKNYKYQDAPKSNEMVLFLDKRGEENIMMIVGKNDVNIKSESYLRKNSIIREYNLPFPAHLNRRKEIYTLSDDGKTLTVKIVTTGEIFPSLSDPSAPNLPKGSLTDNYDKFIYRKS